MRSEAQIAAGKRYDEKRKEKRVTWTTTLKVEEAAHIDSILKKHNMTRADFIRKSVKDLESKQ